MRVRILPTANDLGRTAAQFSSNVINKAIQQQGEARILLSTGASQFETLEHLIHQNIQWSKVTMFHLDEYVNLPDNHSASFIKYLRERFTNFVPLKEVHFVDGRGDIRCSIQQLTEEFAEHLSISDLLELVRIPISLSTIHQLTLTRLMPISWFSLMRLVSDNRYGKVGLKQLTMCQMRPLL